jgi:hypothetical protein
MFLDCRSQLTINLDVDRDSKREEQETGEQGPVY